MNRKLKFAVVSAILAASVAADAQRFPPSEIEEQRQIRPSWSGSWFHEDQSGHGIHVEVLTDGRAVIYWMTYDEGGNQIWLTAVSEEIYEISLTGVFIPAIRIEATAYQTDGMRFGSFRPDDVNVNEWGQLTLTFSYFSCDSGVVTGMSWEPIVPGFTSGEIELQRLTEVIECKDVAFTYEGTWEVQLDFEGPKSTVEVEVVENDDGAATLLYEYTDPDNCVWNGEFLAGFGLVQTQGEKNCSGSIDNYDLAGVEFVEHNVCVDDECARVDQMVIFKEGSNQLIFTR
jgi:hypothetical protein